MAEDPQVEKNRRRLKATEAIGRLLPNPDFQCFVDEILVEALLAQRDGNDLMRGEEAAEGRGAARAIRQILKDIDDSPATYIKLRSMEGRRVRGLG